MISFIMDNLVPRVSLLCLHCLFSTTMEAEKRDPGNGVVLWIDIHVPKPCQRFFRHLFQEFHISNNGDGC